MFAKTVAETSPRMSAYTACKANSIALAAKGQHQRRRRRASRCSLPFVLSCSAASSDWRLWPLCGSSRCHSDGKKGCPPHLLLPLSTGITRMKGNTHGNSPRAGLISRRAGSRTARRASGSRLGSPSGKGRSPALLARAVGIGSPHETAALGDLLRALPAARPLRLAYLWRRGLSRLPGAVVPRLPGALDELSGLGGSRNADHLSGRHEHPAVYPLPRRAGLRQPSARGTAARPIAPRS